MGPGQMNYLDAFIKTAQYLAGLTTQQDVWSETGKLLIIFWGADLSGFGVRSSDGEIVIRHSSFSAELSQIDLESEVRDDIAEVLDSGFLTWRLISSSLEPVAVAFLPITQKNRVTKVMLVGHRTSGLLPKDRLNTYLAVAGLVGTTAQRLAWEVREKERAAELEKTNRELKEQIAQRKRAEQSAKEERQRLYDIMETMPVMVCLLTPDYRVAFANRSLRAKFGEDYGRPCFEYRFGLKGPCEFCESYDALKTDKPHHWEITGPDGSVIDAYDFPFRDTDGSPLILEVDIDITERKRAEQELIRSNEDLQQFAYVASHDLQEPLRNVAGCLQLLEKKYKTKLDANAEQYIQYAVEGAVRMKALIQDLLAYSRITTRGKRPGRIDCEQILDRAVKNLSSAIFETGAVISHDSLPEISGDDTQLLQVFQNLIGNAIKFRRAQPPEVHVSAVKNGDEWTFSVRDNGIGIESRHLDRIFVIFQRLNKRSEYDGTGMGLAIVKKVVERHGGRIWVESEIGVGTTFYFTIPEKGMRT